jgi:hypothetical protein
MGTSEPSLKICEAGSDGGLFYKPGFDTDLPMVPRALLTAIALGYTFLGVAIVADIFMSAIEHITSTEKEIVVKGGDGKKKRMHVKVWNDTVANLTLMALGSSAPEILLSVIELLGNDFKSGELGPSCIVVLPLSICSSSSPSASPASRKTKAVKLLTLKFSQ